MADGIDWAQERARAGNHDQRSLRELAERAGYEVSEARGKGSHLLAVRDGLARPITIQSTIYRRIALVVIAQLEKGAQ